MFDILVGGYEFVRLHPGTAVVLVVAAYGVIQWARKKAAQSKAAGGV